MIPYLPHEVNKRRLTNKRQFEWDVKPKSLGFKTWKKNDKITFLLIVIPLILLWITAIIKLISWII